MMASCWSVAFFGVSPLLQGGIGMSTEENKALVRRWFVELNKGNLDAADEIYAADYVLHDPGAPPNLPPGPEGVKQFLAPILAGLSNSQGTIEHLVAEDDKVAVWATFTGTHTGELAGVSPTGNQVSILVTSIIRIAGGKFAEEWELADGLTMMQQIGAIPMPGA